MTDFERVIERLKKLQSTICTQLEEIDGAAVFSRDEWMHEDDGGGLTRVISHGNVFEKGGVNFSAVSSVIPPFLRSKVSEKSNRFSATGLSLVLHPLSPWVPIVHMNIRYFETDAGDCWFGGGIDLTPIFVNVAQAAQFHKVLKQECDTHHTEYYNEFKRWADEYFYLPHREETRGVGGIFYDYLRPNEQRDYSALTEFMFGIGNSFLPAYLPIVKENMHLPYEEMHVFWQRIRRGRYAEFNLLYDRGTRFGLETAGRTESILMSLPPMASWHYNFIPPKGTEEDKTLTLLKKNIDWCSY
jgi:coproporphyrinogen III oxidase